jgi:hypothetical protein
MFLSGSRYAKAQAFAAPEGQTAAFPGVRARPIPSTPGVIEHTVAAGERLDLLARHYYNDDRLWWRIVDANPEAFYGGDLVREEEVRDATGALKLESMVGRVILIPRAGG